MDFFIATVGGLVIVVLLAAALLRTFNSMSRTLEQREQVMRVTDQRFQGILDNANAAIYVKDADSRYLLVNREFEQIRGLAADEVIGHSEEDIGPRVSAEQIRNSDRAVIESGASMTFEQEMTTQSGPRIYLSLKFPVQTEDGRVTAIAGISTDLTGQKALLAEAVEASRLKSGFVANMSHEIRTPLNGVVGMTNLLRETSLDPVQRGYTDALAASSVALLAVISDVLDFSKIEAGHLELDPTDFELGSAVKEARQMLAEQAHFQGLELSHTIDPDLPITVNGDRGRLRQILLNLMSNAIKFTTSGEVSVHVSGAGDEMVRFEVRDTGVGIDSTEASRLFEPFVQGDQSTTRLFGGTGIGLTIARELAHQMGGEIGAEPRAGAGSMFWFTAKLCGAATEAIDVSPLDRAPTPSTSALALEEGPLILIAEDNEINDAVATALLGKQGLRTVVAHNGREAVEMALATDYAAILMDCQMPEIDGYEATRRIREAEHGRHVPIIAMTAHSMTGDRERCLAAGMDDYLSKPMRAEELASVMSQQLSGWKQDAPSPSRETSDVDEIFDEAIVGELREALTLEMREGLIRTFEESLPKCMSEIEDAIRDDDTDRLRRAAHLLSGSSASLGASALMLSCRQLEHESGDRDQTVELERFAQLRAAATLACVSLREQLL